MSDIGIIGAPTPKLVLDLQHFAHKQAHGDITVIMTWMLTDADPCIVMIPTHKRENSMSMVPCIIPLASAFKWDEKVGDQLFQHDNLKDFAIALGFNPADTKTRNRILRLIRDYIGDLIAMPLITSDGKGIVADVFRTDKETGKTKHIEVTGHV